MEEHQHHVELVRGLYAELKPIFDLSAQPMYLYLDDAHKVCNQKFASLLGFGTPEEWTEDDFLQNSVAESSKDAVVSAYHNAMENGVASEFEVTFKKKDGSTHTGRMILVPLSFQGHLFALHFITT